MDVIYLDNNATTPLLPEVAAGLRTTGHFLSARVAAALGDRPLPEARRRFADLIARQG